jgi:hypothetical protein
MLKNKLALNHVFNLFRTPVKVSKKPKGSWLHMMTLVSSVKRVGEEILFNTGGRSLLYIKKSRGPKMDTCGTP